MKEWKQAYRLAKFEIAVSIKSYFITCTFYIAISWIFMLAFDLYLEGEFRFFDLMFLLIFIMFPTWMKRKEFQMRKMDGDLWTTPSIIMLQQLPIPKETIVKSRFIIHSFYSFPFQLILLILMPLISDNFRATMTPLAYIAFLLLWLSISIAVGFMMAASEAGGNFGTKVIVLSFIYLLIGVGVFYFLFPLLSDKGFVEWTMSISKDWTLLTVIVAVALSIGGWKYWQTDMQKTLKKTDFL